MTTEERVTEVEQRAKSNSHRIDEMQSDLKNLTELTASVKVLATKQENVESDVREIWRAGDTPANPMVNEALAKLAEPNYHVGDILTTVRVLSAPWHACDGSTFSRTAYPALYSVLGGTTLPSISYSSDTTTYIKMADD